MDIIHIGKKQKTKNEIEVNYLSFKKNNNFDFLKADSLIDKMIKNNKCNNLEECVIFLKTILKDSEEDTLEVRFENSNGFEYVKYDKNILSHYRKNIIGDYYVEYEKGKGIRICDSDVDKEDKSFDEVLLNTEKMTESVNQIQRLRYAKPIELKKEDKIIIELYKLFFDETPDFTNEETAIKVQCMLLILSEFRISTEETYKFVPLKEQGLPESQSLKNLINKLYPFGKIDNVEDNLEFNTEITNKIKIIGKSINEEIKTIENPLDSLINMSKIIYNKRCYFYPKPDKIAELTHLSNKEVDETLKLTKTIHSKLEKE